MNDFVDITKIINKLEGKEEFDSFVLVAGISRMALTINIIKSYLRLCDIDKKKNEIEFFKAYSNKIDISTMLYIELHDMPCKLHSDNDPSDSVRVTSTDVTIISHDEYGDEVTEIVNLKADTILTDEQFALFKSIYRIMKHWIDEFASLANEYLAASNNSIS
jgi:hypothetical protein